MNSDDRNAVLGLLTIVLAASLVGTLLLLFTETFSSIEGGALFPMVAAASLVGIAICFISKYKAE